MNIITEFWKRIQEYPVVEKSLTETKLLLENKMQELNEAEIRLVRLEERIEVFEKNKAATCRIELNGSSNLAEALYSVMISSWTTLGLAKTYGIDPIAIPWVDYFKEKLDS